MPTVTINNNFTFTAEARAKLHDVQITFPAIPMPALLVKGDLVAFDDLGPITFVVLGREFQFRSEGQLDVTYLLDVPEGENEPSRLRLVDSAQKPG